MSRSKAPYPAAIVAGETSASLQFFQYAVIVGNFFFLTMFIADFSAGWLAGGAGLLVGHPLDTIKVRMQTMNYGGIFHVLKSTFRNESVGGFYKGMMAPFISVGFLHSVLFAGYGATLRILHPTEANIEHRKDLPMTEIIFATCVGAVIQWIPAVPVEVIKTKLQIQRENVGHFWEAHHHISKETRLYQGTFDCAKRVFVKQGIKGLYQGGSVQLGRDVIGFAFHIPVYEFLYRKMHHTNETFAQIMAGGIAGSVSWISICPLDVVKSRMQAQTEGNVLYKSSWHCAQVTYRNEGAGAFFKGGLVAAVRGFPVNAVLFVAYAKSLAFFEKL